MKVFIVTDAKPLCAERYIGAFASEKAAEKFIRGRYPNARKEESGCGGYASFLCKKPGQDLLMFIHREELQ